MSSLISPTSTSTTTDYYLYRRNYESPWRSTHIKKSHAERPLSFLKQKEDALKEERDQKMSLGMPAEQILFDPKDLVLGGK